MRFITLDILLLTIIVIVLLNKKLISILYLYLNKEIFKDILFFLYTTSVFFILLGYYIPNYSSI